MSLKKSWNVYFESVFWKCLQSKNFFFGNSCGLRKTQRAWWCLGGPSSSWWPMQRSFKPKKYSCWNQNSCMSSGPVNLWNPMTLVTSPCCFDDFFFNTPQNWLLQKPLSSETPEWVFMKCSTFHPTPLRKAQFPAWSAPNSSSETSRWSSPPEWPSTNLKPSNHGETKKTTDPTRGSWWKIMAGWHLGGDVGRFAYRSIRTFTQLLLVQLVVVLDAQLFLGWIGSLWKINFLDIFNRGNGIEVMQPFPND